MIQYTIFKKWVANANQKGVKEMDKKLTMLMILDGFGMNEKAEGNAVKMANILKLVIPTLEQEELFTKI